MVLVCTSVFAVALIGFNAANYLNSLATKQEIGEIREYIVSENVRLKHEIDAAEEASDALQARLDDIEDALTDHLEKHAGVLAAERERDKRKAAQAARDARARFREGRQRGLSLRGAVESTYDSEL